MRRKKYKKHKGGYMKQKFKELAKNFYMWLFDIALLKLIDYIDTDGDGKLSEEEIRNFISKLQIMVNHLKKRRK